MTAVVTPSSVSLTGLGSTATVVVADARALDDAERLLRAELAAVDAACSRFRPDSELTALNAAAGPGMRVGALLFEFIAVALEMAEATGGMVDPAVGAVLPALGYDRDFARMPGRVHTSAPVAAAPDGWRSVELDVASGSVRLPRGLRLDLGATAKAHAADRAAAAIHAECGCGVLVSLGGDLRVHGEAPGDGWPVRITDDHRHIDGEGPVVMVREGGLATSSTTVRRWRAGRDGGEQRHHVIDPRTGTCATEVWRTVSVCAATCAQANAATTGAIVLGHDAPDWLGGLGLPARLVGVDGGVRTVGGWSPS
ncbi:MAG: FAD:protein FMN transferase [Thermoleophilia bacterium]